MYDSGQKMDVVMMDDIDPAGIRVLARAERAGARGVVRRLLP
jgi:hypothetical protein